MMRIEVGRNSRLLSLQRYSNNKAAASAASAIALMAIILASSTVALTPLFLQNKVFAGTFPGTNGLIAFSSTRDGNAEIYTMNADGSNQQRLTDNTADDYYPSWSPDGTKIAFSSWRDGYHPQIYVMNADGSNQHDISNSYGNDLWLAGLPTGARLHLHQTEMVTLKSM